MVKPYRSDFRIITAIFSGAQIFRIYEQYFITTDTKTDLVRYRYLLAVNGNIFVYMQRVVTYIFLLGVLCFDPLQHELLQ